MSLILPLLAAAAQPSAATLADIRCAAVFAYTTSTAKPEEQAGAIGGFLYFLGKVDAGAPGLDLEKQLVELLAGKNFEADVLIPDGTRCADELQARGSELERIGKALEARGK